MVMVEDMEEQNQAEETAIQKAQRLINEDKNDREHEFLKDLEELKVKWNVDLVVVMNYQDLAVKIGSTIMNYEKTITISAK